MLFESPNAKLFPAFNIPPPVRLSGALGGVEVLDGGLVGGELTAHVLSAQAAAAHAAAAAHQQQQMAVQQINYHPTETSPSSGRSTPVTGAAAAAAPTGTTSPSPSKLFVGGLSWQTSSEKLREYFAMFGPVTDVLIMKDPVTQRSRGFGFITFQEAASVDKVLAVPVHTLDGKRIDPKHATPKSAPRPAKTKKIFVGGVGQDTSADEVRAYFSQFGLVEDAVMLMDQQTKRHRGFGFVTFHSEEAVERVCDIHFHTIKNKKVECKRAQPKEAVAAAPLALGKRLVLRPGRGLVYAAGGAGGVGGVGVGVGGVGGVGAAHAYRYAPYALPAAAALVAPPAPAPAPALPQFGAAYSLAGVDMSSFQGVDWGAMYSLPMYI
ncbi:RNA-binding protein Musashi homolog 2 isoform X1 [Galleria mellonella]|uniref:RNA-binding protein Musashi homolog 2 isoform X1 n=1 Tax=Galleria mellonella TaxID=7137 RepID=A0ABM3MHW8_GALME|nr:RNA-binding protein Musashi homolog 2 isoform X1 [Galleria mellonella]XP_052750775.1 RNA-binding protein Musashi homolog 2 isoform X1 [Galleria mellonella]